ncbi:uncharacterized protein C9orf85 homolog-like [Panicum miliaceum]|uniref:Uncharacterized protein C9orf85 homolog-like n=1 Tax=Panicum miliaceum TaxID=4540 RepID=A0A3L6R3R1_PANMI|nr:uncharacterized protein C9orf85 homolog-like [Panicum miliaceum]
MSKRQGPPKHQNSYAWKPNLGQKINETEPGGRFRPLSEITGVCQRCRDQIDWKRRYGKYKPIVEPAKCQKCGKRAVRQAYHNVCRDCSKDLGICAKCSTRVNELVGRLSEVLEKEKDAPFFAFHLGSTKYKPALLQSYPLELRWVGVGVCVGGGGGASGKMNKGKGGDSGSSVPKIADRSREGDIFPAASLDEYADQAREQDDTDEEAGDFVED